MKKALNIIKYVDLFLQIASLVFFSSSFIKVWIEDYKHIGESNYLKGSGLQFVASLIFMIIIAAVSLIFSLVCYIISRKNENCKDEKKLQHWFIGLQILPIVNVGLFVLLFIVMKTFL